jgi:hypothetical protein
VNIVERHNTPITEQQARDALRSAYSAVFGHAPDIDEAALLLALVWIETKHGDSVQNFSPGNITAGETYQGDAWRPPWFELGESPTPRNRDLHEQMLQGKAPRAFRAFPSLEAGMRDFVQTLRTSFPEVLVAAKGADPDAFREALSQRYSGDYRNTAATATLTSFMREFGGSPKASRSPGLPPARSAPVAPGSGSSLSQSGAASLPVLRVGSKGPAVRLWAKLIGFRKGNDVYDATLEAATVRWQKAKGFTGTDVDGAVGPKTWGTAYA